MNRHLKNQYHAYESITGDSDDNDSYKGAGCAVALVILVVLITCFLLVASFSNNNKKSTSYSDYTRSTGSAGKQCLVLDCDSYRITGSFYCSKHTCRTSGCYERVMTNSLYCSKHQPEKAATKEYSSKKTTEKKDPYHISQYSDVDDFYDDWFDDFDSFDDAELYWDENH